MANPTTIFSRVKNLVDKTMGGISKPSEPQEIGVDPQADLRLLLQEAKAHLRKVDESLISKAFWFCYEIHKHDRRASGEPYYVHLLEVARIVVKEIVLDDVSVTAALLHDIIEDHEDYTVKDIHAEFGSAIAEIVDGVTKITDISKSREITKAESYRKLLLSLVNDVRVILIKFADRLHNMRTLHHLSPERQQRIARETMEIYAPFAHRFGLGNIKWELEDLSFKYIDRDKYAFIKKKLNSTLRDREEYIERFTDPIQKRLQENNIKFEIAGRPKHIYSIYNKMEVQGKDFEELYDLFAIRIILNTEDKNDCFFAYGIVSEIYTPVPERFKDYISVPKKNGYKSLHTTVIGKDGKKVEVQIRTRAMHEVAEKGVAAHFRYKSESLGIEIPSFESKDLEEWANWMRDILDNAGEEGVTQLLESFSLNLYQDEIHVFTPKGELRNLPIDATPVDFAFDIHSAVGLRCIGAKVNGKIVPLDYALKTGDQVEILTSKHYNPSRNWEKFVITHKAKSAIRKFLNDEKRKKIQEGKELWEKKSKKIGFSVNEDDLERAVKSLRFPNKSDFYFALGVGNANIDALIDQIRDRLRPGSSTQDHETQPMTELHLDNMLKSAREQSGRLVVQGQDLSGLAYAFARCCNPVPGDKILGVVTTGSGVKVHRSSCRNILDIREKNPTRVLAMDWADLQTEEFISAIRVTGEDRGGMLNDITNVVVSFNNTSIRGVNIHAFESMFEGVVTVLVRDTEHLNRLFERIKRIQGVQTVERWEG